ncbi:hypothetical protein GF407_17555 [candidate division KSB1 bacterium]|nr:hypothetical protein [candidate division KSB1 bacterium]
MKQAGFIFILIIITSCLSFAKTPTLVDLRAGYYTDVEELYIGGGFRTGLGRSLDLNPNLEYVLIEGGTYMTINVDLLFTIMANRRNFALLGAGLAISRFDPEGKAEGDSDTGLNFLFRYGFITRSAIPYFQAKVIMGDYDDIVLGGGLEFRL